MQAEHGSRFFRASVSEKQHNATPAHAGSWIGRRFLVPWWRSQRGLRPASPNGQRRTGAAGLPRRELSGATLHAASCGNALLSGGGRPQRTSLATDFWASSRGQPVTDRFPQLWRCTAVAACTKPE